MTSRPALIASALLLGACSGITERGQSNAPGQAAYQVTKTADGTCKVWITSGREVESGKIKIGPDCTVDAEAASLSGVELQLRMLQIIERLGDLVTTSP